MKAFLVVYFLLDGHGWTPGWMISGWAPYQMRSEQACWERALELNMQPAPEPAVKWSWTCVMMKPGGIDS